MSILDAPAARLRTVLAKTLRSKVAGEDAGDKAKVIWGKPGERWFTPDDAIWIINSDASMFVGGIRALLLQSLHPGAMAGVAGHSGYKSDPWGRLQRTSDFLALTTFGTIEDAEAVIAKVRGIHERVRGKTDDGTPYHASDPHLLEWVHVAETQSFLETYRLYGRGTLTRAMADEYVAQAAGTGERLGVVDAPRTLTELNARLEAYRPELRATDAAREAARFLLLEPPLPKAAVPGYSMLAAGAVASLPDWARRELHLPDSGLLDTALGRPLGRFSAGVVRWALDDPLVQDERRSVAPAYRVPED